MSHGFEDFQQLLQRAQDGSEDAARDLVVRYGDLILRVIRRRLHHRLRTHFDSQDFLQDVWQSFFANGLHEGTFQDPATLQAFLAQLAARKVADAFRQLIQGEVQNLPRTKSLDGSAAFAAAVAASSDPTPSRALMAREELMQLLAGKPVHHQKLLLLAGSGYTQAEIAEQLGLNVRSVNRLLRKAAEGQEP